MRTLIPPPVSAVARPNGRAKLWTGVLVGILTAGIVLLLEYLFLKRLDFGVLGLIAVIGLCLAFQPYALTRRSLLLFAAGVLGLLPSFFHPQIPWLMFGWDGVVLALILLEGANLPAPKYLRVSRTFLDSPRLGELTRVELELRNDSNRIVEVDLTDDLESSLKPTPEAKSVVAYPRDPIRAVVDCFPGRRGDLRLGNVFLRYRSRLRLVERWAVCDMAQSMRVFPAMTQSGEDSSLFLMRARQIEMQKRRLRLRGIGREFESLRDYQDGDELRNVSWPATARRARLITRQFTTERSQQVWVVLDAGRLSRTAFTLVRSDPEQEAASEAEQAANLSLTVTQLDQATTAGVMLAEVVGGSGDKCGLLTYGRKIQQQLLPGAGASHLRSMIDQLSQVRGEAAEANHLNAAARLKQLQRRRGMVVWITEIADSAGRPEVVAAVSDLVRRHLVLLVVLKHPELDELAARHPENVQQMYASAAAKEMLDRRKETILKLRRQGVLVVESTPGEIGLQTINSYLDVKARGLL